MAGELGKASLDLEANLAEFEKNIKQGERLSGGMRDALEGIVTVARVAEIELNKVKMGAAAGLRSREIADRIERSVGSVGRAAMEASHHLEQVKLGAEQAAESDAAGDVIDRKLKSINRNANETRRALDRVRLAGGVPGRSGVGVGPFGSGFGRVGVLGAAIAGGALTAPAAAPAAAGLLAAIPSLAFAGAGALGTLVLAFKDVGKAIGGDLKAFKELEPAQQAFVLRVRSLTGWVDKLKSVAGNALFPGLTAGLTSALSPGTVTQITKAVQEFGHAIGQSAAQWGRYFGSPQFQALLGPLMQSGARNLRVLSSAMLHLFDALSVLGRAAIPFTNWLVTAADKGAKLASAWMRAKEATGGLGKAMHEAQASLRLVGQLALALGRAVGALGVALYPVSKIAVKDLTAGLNALARIINHNQKMIRDIVGGALKAFVSIVKVTAAILGPLLKALNAVAHAIGGWKNAWLAIFALGIASKLRGIAGAMFAVETAAGAEGAAGGVKALRLSLIGKVGLVAAVGVASYELTTLALKLTGLDKKLRSVGGDLQGLLTKVPGANKALESVGLGDPGKQFDGKAIPSQQQASAVIAAARRMRKQGFTKDQIEGQFEKWHPDWAFHDIDVLVNAAFNTSKKAAAEALADVGRGADIGNTDPVPGKPKPKPVADSPFGTPPPFDKNVPKPRRKRKPPAPPVIPALASRAEALASANASRASALHNVGATAKRYLEGELADLETADRALHEKFDKATGKARTRLFAEITRVENRERRVRSQIRDAMKKSRDEELAFAVEQAKLAVEQATEGTAAYDKAVKAEERALKAQIAYLDKIAHNKKLSLSIRSKALREELADERTLKALLKTSTASSADLAANEKQFLDSYQAIIQGYGSNATETASGKTDSHLYDLVHETRTSNKHLKDLTGRFTFPASGYSVASAEAAIG